MLGVIIGPIAPAEAAIVEEMSLAHLSSAEREKYFVAAPRGIKQLRRILAGETGVCLVARTNDQVIGYVYGDDRPATVSDIRYAELMSICVVPQYRRRSVGRQLNEAFVSWARSKGYARVSVKTGWRQRDKLLPFYEAAGFKPMTIELELHFDGEL